MKIMISMAWEEPETGVAYVCVNLTPKQEDELRHLIVLYREFLAKDEYGDTFCRFDLHEVKEFPKPVNIYASWDALKTDFLIPNMRLEPGDLLDDPNVDTLRNLILGTLTFEEAEELWVQDL